MDAKPGIPLVYWAQKDDRISLRVDVEAHGQPVVTTTAKRLEFSCDGTAPTTGRRRYAFAIDFFADIVPGSEGYDMKAQGSRVDLIIKKSQKNDEYWPRLHRDGAKPAWLKIDFDRFHSGEAESEEEKERHDPDREPNMKNTVDELLKNIKDKRPNFREPGLDFKKMYLTAYNTFMLLGFFGIFVSLIRNYVQEGSDFYQRTYHTVGLNVRIMQIAQCAEIVHAALGLVKTSPLSSLLQSTGRLVALHVIVFEPYLQTLPAVYWLFVAWSAVELIRYPYYLAQLHGYVPEMLKVLRYTSWIVLYPMGMILEAIIYLQALEAYPLTYPGALFHLGSKSITVAHFIALYLFIFPVGCIFMLRYMFYQTKSQLFAKKGASRPSKKVQ
ncbi:very-long-chain (3R)-3-hydroxyacyl-CoA dehydratase-like [Paramacrobiotus metropolitanus]|uniref:very-long-chain (3R)-3-hydroxyacyl-CoA dehydratase-like n=1 Tax=Paramacrobiotus metropolitanus TaxID=2943436 RepID=UPI0024465A7C|nr:very-long-chain (3R)-3-hydroxyacyl-CoA dehydratase-like [Paramacrobiotus metropolitanus]